jgi:hypothetical protein
VALTPENVERFLIDGLRRVPLPAPGKPVAIGHQPLSPDDGAPAAQGEVGPPAIGAAQHIGVVRRQGERQRHLDGLFQARLHGQRRFDLRQGQNLLAPGPGRAGANDLAIGFKVGWARHSRHLAADIVGDLHPQPLDERQCGALDEAAKARERRGDFQRGFGLTGAVYLEAQAQQPPLCVEGEAPVHERRQLEIAPQGLGIRLAERQRAILGDHRPGNGVVIQHNHLRASQMLGEQLAQRGAQPDGFLFVISPHKRGDGHTFGHGSSLSGCRPTPTRCTRVVLGVRVLNHAAA